MRRKTRCCNAACQHYHWRAGQADLQEKRRGGNAQQCHAHKKYKEAVAVAVEKRADDTKRSDVLQLVEVAG
jgi:hypothetical protein|tara:strand:- start:463 stop:675 length:213 start_codon:yes stop_codon:yes gene_type:complete